MNANPGRGLTEGTARFIIKKLIRGMLFSHSRKVVHLDIKIENIMIDGELNLANYESWVKFADYGLSHVCIDSTDEIINNFSGT